MATAWTENDNVSVLSLPPNKDEIDTSMNSVSPSISPRESDRWLKSLNNAIPAIVVIRVCTVRAFDGQAAMFSHATGFVVDKERGIILTNRHVVTPGPVTADAIFKSKEEVDLQPIYRDPVHDFGLFSFDPKKIRFLELQEIPLDPQGAKVGVEIRVVGNDAGEKLSILPGILAKVDREAPRYGSSHYNDFNTFYYAAASSTSGGSSGSPVLNIYGHAIALNAGGAKAAASSFYLPLDRVVRVLKLIQEKKLVSRGTLQTIFRHRAFDEVRRLGLSSEAEAEIRATFPEETGMLTVEQVVPSSVAHEKLQPGDILVTFAGKYQTTFIPIEEFLDENVNEMVEIEIQRGGSSHTFTFLVEDLHEITPRRFLSMSGSVFHSFSYQLAKNASLPVGGVYLAQSGHMMLKAGVGAGCIIVSVGTVSTPTFDTFVDVMSSLPNGTRTSLRFVFSRDRHRVRTAVITIDRQWFPMSIYNRNDTDGLWHPTPCVMPTTEYIPKPETAATPLSAKGKTDDMGLLQAIVLVTFNIPHLIDGICSSSYTGAGIVVDKTRGLVLVDRNTVPIGLGDVIISIAASLEIPGSVIFLHPVQNYAIVQYEPTLVGETVVNEVDLSSDTELLVGDSLDYIGIAHNFSVVSQKSVISKIDRLSLREFIPPRFRATNVEVVHFDRVTKSVGGIFSDTDGKAVVLYLSFSYMDSGGQKEVFRGMPVTIFRDVVNALKRGETPVVKVSGIQFLEFPLSKARSGLGLPNTWVKKLELCHPDRKQVLSVKRCSAGTDAAKKLQSGDLVLSIDGVVISKDVEVESICQKDTVTMVVFRNYEEITVELETTELETTGTERVIMWSGLIIQSPHYAVRSLGYMPEEGGGVYISRWAYGSPAHKYGLRATLWIVEVNDVPTPDLDAFLRVVNDLQSGDFVRLRTRDLATKCKVFTLKTDYHYWPSIELIRKGTQWICVR